VDRRAATLVAAAATASSCGLTPVLDLGGRHSRHRPHGLGDALVDGEELVVEPVDIAHQLEGYPPAFQLDRTHRPHAA